MKPGSCVYAHGEAELRPLPKEELCERYLEGKCSNARVSPQVNIHAVQNRPLFSKVQEGKKWNLGLKPRLLTNACNRATACMITTFHIEIS